MLLVSAIASGQGKTTVTAALARKLAARGRRVRVFKAGPDFIDPMLLERASGAPVHTLDLWMVGLESCQRQLAEAAREADVILIEGVMGLYDGAPSSADLARALGVPVLAVIDASAMAQTAGAVVHGLREFGPVEIAGVIANRVGGAGHCAMVAASLRTTPLLGSLPPQQMALPERHLGLVLPAEVVELEALLDALAADLTIDEPAWARLPLTRLTMPAPMAARPADSALAGATVAIAHDAAFAFLYPANVDCLRALGATVCYFSPLDDEPVPSGASAVYLPGGYPELHAAAFSSAQRWQASIRTFHAQGMPILAECGGMMALADSLADGRSTARLRDDAGGPGRARSAKPGDAAGDTARPHFSLRALRHHRRAGRVHRFAGTRRRWRSGVPQRFAHRIFFSRLFRLLSGGGSGAFLPRRRRMSCTIVLGGARSCRSAFAGAQGDVILVSNEVGMGIVPRRFADEAGRLNAAVAARCDHAVMLAGLSPLMMALLLAAGVGLDLLLGETRRWHPLVGFGRFAAALERRLKRGHNRYRLARRILTALAAQLAHSLWRGALLYFALGLRSLGEHNVPIAQVLDAGIRLGLPPDENGWQRLALALAA